MSKQTVVVLTISHANIEEEAVVLLTNSNEDSLNNLATKKCSKWSRPQLKLLM